IPDYVFLVNPDILFDDLSTNPFDACIDILEQNPQAGIIGCRLLHINDLIEFDGGMGNSHRWYNEHKSTRPRTEVDQVEWITGAFMGIRTSVFATIGLLDELLPHWVSDQEFCRRASFAGIQSLISPMSLYHIQGSSVTGRTSH